MPSASGVQIIPVRGNQTAWVAYDPSQVTLPKLQQATQSMGYDLIIDTEHGAEKQEQLQRRHYQQLKTKTIWAAVFSAPIMVIGMLFMDLPYGSWIMMVLALPVLWLGRDFYVNAWKQARHGKANMDTLVALSTGIAFLYSLFATSNPHFFHSRGLHPHVYYEAATTIIAFILLGKLLEDRAKSNTSSAIRKLIGLQAKTVRILDYKDKGDANRKGCSLNLSLLDRMGVTLDGFGDASSRLEGL